MNLSRSGLERDVKCSLKFLEVFRFEFWFFCLNWLIEKLGSWEEVEKLGEVRAEVEASSKLQ